MYTCNVLQDLPAVLHKVWNFQKRRRHPAEISDNLDQSEMRTMQGNRRCTTLALQLPAAMASMSSACCLARSCQKGAKPFSSCRPWKSTVRSNFWTHGPAASAQGQAKPPKPGRASLTEKGEANRHHCTEHSTSWDKSTLPHSLPCRSFPSPRRSNRSA